MKIPITGDPIRQQAYCAPLAKWHLIETTVKEMLEDGIIRTSTSSLALSSGFWQIPVAEEDIEKTAFICHVWLFKFTHMP